MDIKKFSTIFQREAMLLCCFQSRPHDVGGRGREESKIMGTAASTVAAAATAATASAAASTSATTATATRTTKQQIGNNLYSKEQVVKYKSHCFTDNFVFLIGQSSLPKPLSLKEKITFSK